MAAFDGGDIQGGMDQLSADVRRFTAAGDPRRAAMACARLGWAFETFVGNRAAARAWFHRAARLLEDEPACVEQGWVALAGLGCDVDDPHELLRRAELALDRARRFGDVDLEAKALADGGLAQVQAGNLVDGMSMLDEAVALWCGPAIDQDAAGMGVCSFFTACYHAAAFDRVGHWLDDLRRVGLVGPAPGVPVFLSGHCDAVQATALMELGRWTEAEAVLTRAVAEFEACMPLPSWHPAIALADLRTRQGRLADAEALLLGKEAHMQALLPAARLHLARGDTDLAIATASRGLRMVGPDVLRAVELLAILTDAELAAGHVEAAREVCGRMTERAAGLAVPRLAGLAAAGEARVLAAEGDLASAITVMEQAVDALPVGLPVMKVTLGFELVRLHEQAGNRAAAQVEAGRAASVLAGLDVTLPPGGLELLERLAHGKAAAKTATLRCEQGSWAVEFDGVRIRLATTKGLRYLATLMASPGAERHVLDLVDQIEGVGPDGPDRHRLGDAGELLDGTARQAYRRRVEQLRGEIEHLLALGEDERATKLQEECDELVAQLAAAFGLSGRSRRAASAAERARLNVTRSVRTAIARIRDDLPEAGKVLDRRVRTGLYCAFEPDLSDPVRWVVHPRLNATPTT
jgi:tetratricopeptide (TPR) repeat protein